MEQHLARPTDTRRFKRTLAAALEAAEIAKLEQLDPCRSPRVKAMARYAAVEAELRHMTFANRHQLRYARWHRDNPAVVAQAERIKADAMAYYGLAWVAVAERAAVHPAQAALPVRGLARAPMRCARARSRRSRVVRAAAATSGAGDPDPEPERRPRALRSSAGGAA